MKTQETFPSSASFTVDSLIFQRSFTTNLEVLTMKSRHFFTNALILLVSLAPLAVTAQEFQPDALKDEPWVDEVP